MMINGKNVYSVIKKSKQRIDRFEIAIQQLNIDSHIHSYKHTYRYIYRKKQIHL